MKHPFPFSLAGLASATARTSLLVLSCSLVCLSAVCLSAGAQDTTATSSQVPGRQQAPALAGHSSSPLTNRALRGGAVPDENDACGTYRTMDRSQLFGTQDAVSALDGSGTLTFGNHARSRVGMALGGLGGYDSALLYKSGLSSGFSGGQAVFAALVNKRRWIMMLQDGVTVVGYTAKGRPVDALNRTSLDVQGMLNGRWSWNVNGFASYGSDALRAVAPGQERVIASTSVPVPNAAGYGLYAGKVFAGDAAAHLHSQVSARSGWDLSVTNGYQKYFDTTTSINSALARASYLHLATRSLTYGGYGLATHQSGSITCSSGGGGLEVAYRPSKRLGLEGSGGPAFGTSSCGRALQLIANGTVYYRPAEQTALYATASRTPNNGVLPDAVWLTTYAGGIRHSFNPRLGVAADYADSHGSATNSRPSYREDYVSATMRVSLWGSLSQDVSIRHFMGYGAGAKPDRMTLLVGLWWTLSRGAREVSARALDSHYQFLERPCHRARSE